MPRLGDGPAGSQRVGAVGQQGGGAAGRRGSDLTGTPASGVPAAPDQRARNATALQIPQVVSPVTLHAVVIPTYDRPRQVERLLACLRDQTIRPDLVIVADDTPDDRIRQVVDGFEGLNVVFVRCQGPPSLTRARNVAAGYVPAEAELMTHLDSDVALEPDYLERIQDLMRRRPDAIGCMGWVTDFPRGSWWKNLATAPFLITRASKRQCARRFPLRLLYPTALDREKDTNWLYGCNMTYRREVFDDHEFNAAMERYSYAEDLEFSLRVGRASGRPFVITPTARLHHPMHDDGRIPPLDLFRMRLIHRHIIVHHYFRMDPIRWLALWWSHVGYLLFYSYLHRERTRAYFREFRRVIPVLRRRRRAVKAGDFAAFNDLYSFMQAQRAAPETASAPA